MADDYIIRTLRADGRPTDLMAAAELETLRNLVDKMINLLENNQTGNSSEWLKEAKIIRS